MAETASGQLARVDIRVQPSPSPIMSNGRRLEEAPPPADILTLIFDRRSDIRSTLERALSERLEGRVYVDPLVVRAGSVEILAIVAGVGVLIKSYSDFVKNINEAVEVTRKAVSDIAEGTAAVQSLVTAEWIPGPAVELTAQAQPTRAGSTPQTRASGGRSTQATSAATTSQSTSAAPESRVTPAATLGYPLLRLLLPYATLICATTVALVALLRLTG